MRKVRIIKTPGQALNKEIFNKNLHPDKLQKKNTRVKKYVEEVPDELANIEAERGETFLGDYMGQGIPQLLKIGGKPHSKGGTKMAAPDGYVFSKYRPMKIKSPEILESFGVNKPMVPADISKKFDFMDSLKGLYDPMSDPLQLKTYEYNVSNALNKLGKLALTQEAFKGFPDGIPAVSMPYLQKMQMNPTMFIDNEQETPDNEPAQAEGEAMARFGGQMSMSSNMPRFQARNSMIDAARNKMNEELYPKQSNVRSTPYIQATPTYKDVVSAKKKIKLSPKAKYIKDLEKVVSKGNLSDINSAIDYVNTNYKDDLKKSDFNFIRSAVLAPAKGASQALSVMPVLGPLLGSYLQNEVETIEENVNENSKLAKLYKQLNFKKNILEREKEDTKTNNFLRAIAANPTADLEVKTYINNASRQLDDISNQTPSYETYSKKDLNKISKLRGDIYTRWINSKKPVTPAPAKTSGIPTATPKQIQAMEQPQTKPMGSDTSLFDEDFDKYKMGGNVRRVRIIKHPNNKMAMESGGMIPKFQPGGKWSKKADGSVYWKLPNGSEGVPVKSAIDALKAKGFDWKGSVYDSKKAPAVSVAQTPSKGTTAATTTTKPAPKTGTTTTTTNKTASEFDPYGTFTEDTLAQLLEDPTILRKKKVKGTQKQTSKGHYGEDVTVEEFAKRNPEYVKAFEEKNKRKFDPDKDAEQFQKDYNKHVEALAYKRATEAGYKDSDAKALAKKFVESQGFYEGALKTGDPRGIDKKFGEFTSSRFEPIFRSIKKEEEKKKEPEKEKEVITKEEPEVEHFYDQPYYVPPPQEWLQDRMMRAFNIRGRARARKFSPEMYNPELFLPEPTLYDPTREAAAIAEVANIGAQQAANLGQPPQQFASAYSAIQGNAARDIANTFGRYQNMNVGVMNQYGNVRANLLNQQARLKASNANEYSRMKNIADQQWINERNMWDEKMTKDNIQALTNMAQTDVMNSMYPQYAIDPSTGGFRPYFLRGRTPKPAATKTSQDILREIAMIRESDKDMTFKEASRIWELANQGSSPENAYMKNPHMYPQYPTGPYSGGTGYGQPDEEED